MLLILGLDGATLDLVAPWAADGTLPNLARLMREGAWGRLASTIPPATFPSWTTFMTGVNPGRHGIFDFTRRVAGRYAVRFVNATSRKMPSIWSRLSAAGRRVAVLGVPGTFPPEAINGCMVSGFDTPVTTRADRRFVYPAELAPEIERLGGFPFADFQEFDIGPGWHEQALASLLGAIERKTRLAEWLLDRERWDCFMLLLGESDTVAHHFWAHHDADSPRRSGTAPLASGDPIRTVYAALDATIGRLLARVPGARVLVVSDHGFGGAGDTAVYLNRWLAEQGLLAWQPSGGIGQVAGWLRRAAVRAIPPAWQARCFRLAGGRLANAVESGVRFGGIDWRETRAFSEELNYFPSIWLNVHGREPLGLVAPEAYRAACAELTARLLAWRDPIHDAPVVRRVWQRDEVYHGAHVDGAPDLLLDLATPGGYSYVCLSSRARGGPVLERLPGSRLRGGKLGGMGGSHRPDGLFVLCGEGIGAGELPGVSIADMGPSVLSLCGVAVPDGLDGRRLACLGAGEAGAAAQREAATPGETVYDSVEEACIRDQLVRLGYLE